MNSSDSEPITVVGWKGCPYFARSKILLDKISVGEVKEFSDRRKYKTWLSKNTGVFRSDQAKTHVSCPFVFKGDLYIGGNDAFHAWVAWMKRSVRRMTNMNSKM